MKKIPLTQGQVALVDDSDFLRVARFNWYAARRKNGNWYARRMVIESGVRKCLGMHTFILGVPYVDHRDNDGLNNQRVNLRAATQAENNRARCHKASGCYSQYRGVTFRKLTGRWVAKIKKNRRLFNLGYFTSEVEAALAYDKAARRLFGDFAAPNFSDNGLQNTV